MRILSVLLFMLICQAARAALIPAGTQVDARLETLIQTATSDAGDEILAVVVEPIRADGKVMVPAGARLNGRVETIEPATETNEGRVRLAFREIEFPDGRRVSAWITNSFSASPPKRKLRYALYTGIGAVAGGLVGGKKARVSGILGGTIVGLVIAGNSGNGKSSDLKLKPGRVLRLRIGEDLQL
jgi:hypothetical protein